MTAEQPTSARDEAIRWHLRLADATAEEWDAFAEWLAADIAHAQAYDMIEMADAEAGPAALAAGASAPAAANDDVPDARRRLWMGAAAAVALVLATIVGQPLLRGGNPYDVATAPGEKRTIALPSGDQIALNGDSRVTLDRDNPRYAELAQGEALFTVRHDPSAPFRVRIGDGMIQDVGTVFNVARDKDGVRVAVAEGSVIYNPDAEAVTLAAGDALHDPGGSAAIVRARVERVAVGSWTQGQLNYADAPLSRVASDLARAIGEPVAIDPKLATRRFTGTIRVDADRQRLFADIGILLDIQTGRRNGGWVLAARDRARR